MDFTNHSHVTFLFLKLTNFSMTLICDVLVKGLLAWFLGCVAKDVMVKKECH